MRRVVILATIGVFSVALCEQKPGLSRANAIYENYENMIIQRMDRHWHDGQYWACIGFLQVLLGIHSRNDDYNSQLVWMYGNVGEHGLAIVQAIRFRMENPLSPLAAETEATIYRNLKVWARIPPVLEPTIERAGVNNFVLLVKAYEEMGLYGEAVRILELRKQKFPQDQVVDAVIARMRKKMAGG